MEMPLHCDLKSSIGIFLFIDFYFHLLISINTYSNAYTLVLHKHGELLYDGVEKTIGNKLYRTAQEVEKTTGIVTQRKIANSQ